MQLHEGNHASLVRKVYPFKCLENFIEIKFYKGRWVASYNPRKQLYLTVPQDLSPPANVKEVQHC